MVCVWIRFSARGRPDAPVPLAEGPSRSVEGPSMLRCVPLPLYLHSDRAAVGLSLGSPLALLTCLSVPSRRVSIVEACPGLEV